MRFKRSVVAVNGFQVPVLTQPSRPLRAYVRLSNGALAQTWWWSLRFNAAGTIAALEEPQGPQRNALAVTIVPQTNCNARCGYCINNVQGGNGLEVVRIANKGMTDHMIASVSEFIEAARTRNGADLVDIMLFGGEPLLNPERCYKILDAIRHRGRVSMTTNGTRLTPKVAIQLAARGLVDFQVTLDGNREYHDKVRILADGGGTYDDIVGNLKALEAHPDILPERRIRVHMTRDNVDGLPGLIDELAGVLTPNRYILYPAIVDDNGIGWTGGVDGKSGRAMLDELSVLAAGYGFEPTTSAPITGECGYCSGEFGEGGMVIGPDGRLYSCWDNMGHDETVVGNVFSGYVDPQSHADRWTHCGDGSRNNDRTGPPVLDREVSTATWLQMEHRLKQALGRQIAG